MRCQACNKLLEDAEAARKNKRTGEYLDLCYTCSSVVVETLWELEEPPVAPVEVKT